LTHFDLFQEGVDTETSSSCGQIVVAVVGVDSSFADIDGGDGHELVVFPVRHFTGTVQLRLVPGVVKIASLLGSCQVVGFGSEASVYELFKKDEFFSGQVDVIDFWNQVFVAVAGSAHGAAQFEATEIDPTGMARSALLAGG
jgi:hypothetical protein